MIRLQAYYTEIKESNRLGEFVLVSAGGSETCKKLPVRLDQVTATDGHDSTRTEQGTA